MIAAGAGTNVSTFEPVVGLHELRMGQLMGTIDTTP